MGGYFSAKFACTGFINKANGDTLVLYTEYYSLVENCYYILLSSFNSEDLTTANLLFYTAMCQIKYT